MQSTLNDFSQLQELFTQMSFREVQTKKQAEAERIKREIAELETQSKPIETYELIYPDVPMDITRRNGKYVQKRKAYH
jgi:hypothetical protein